MDKSNVVYLYNGILSSPKQEVLSRATTTWMNLEGSVLREISHKKTNATQFHLHEVSKVAKLVETESKWGLPGAGKRRTRKLLFSGYGVSVLQHEAVLEICGPTMRTQLMSLCCILKGNSDGQFYISCF